MKSRKLMEWHRGVAMVFRVIGHVPCQSHDELACECCSRILQHIRNMRATPVFCEQKQPKKWLTNEQGNNPKIYYPTDARLPNLWE
mmetsp:Transcript_17542/g.24494  ORF Transcript_17542/g.24494 Transcript_17542/m.24494 type:complete len:86 (+) Transcript_17542:166-423(+)